MSEKNEKAGLSPLRKTECVKQRGIYGRKAKKKAENLRVVMTFDDFPDNFSFSESPFADTQSGEFIGRT